MKYYVKQMITQKVLAIFLVSVLNTCYLLHNTNSVYASLPSSTNYRLQKYSFGSGGTNNASSTNYQLHGIAGEVEFGRPSSTNFKAGDGLTYMMNASVSAAPTLTNTGTTYDRLLMIINQGSNPTDVTYAVAISTDNFVSDTKYVKSDNTVGNTLTTADFRSYTSWGSSTGVSITGLQRNTIYYVKAKARQGSFSESEWGPASSGVATSDPTLTFSVDASSVTFANLNSSNSFTDSGKTTTITTSTNAYNGYIVNARESGPLTQVGGSQTISDYISPNSAPTAWSGNGFGYTTNDNNLTGGSANRFNNSTNYAGFTTSSPGDPVADHPGPVTSEISNEQFTIGYRVTVGNTQKAARYTTAILYIVVPSY